MSGAFKLVGKVAGLIALIPSPIQPYAAAIAAVANIGAQLTAKKPVAKGTVNNITVANEAPSPYLIGRTYSGGVLRYDQAWGGKVGKVQNPYRAMVMVYSVCGPVNALDSRYADFEEIAFSGDAATGYYADFMWNDTQLGARPESTALTAEWAGMPEWTSASKLSSKAAILWSLKFDKDGKRYSGGVPQLGAVWEGVKAYDPRLDSTYPGGTGAHRIDDETTWAYSDNPALHALTYLYGRYIGGKKVFGVGLPVESIDRAAFVAHANVCDANSWTIGGVIFEPGDRWQNLKDILAAGSAEPVFSGGMVSVKYDAPRVSLATITADDLADEDCTVRAMQTWRDRLNTIIPKARLETHKWEYVALDAVQVGSYVTEDGEEKVQEIQWNLVQDEDQATQLAAYALVNGRELVIDLHLKHDWRFYQPGDMLTIDIEELGLIEQDAVMVSRTIDPATLTVRARFIGETPDKHDYALGRTGVAPPTPSLLSPQDADEAQTLNVTRPPFVQATEPTSGESIDTDVWFDSDDNYKQYVRTGGVWVAVVADSASSGQTLPITAQVQTTTAISFSLGDGQTADLTARIKVDALSNSCTQFIEIEWRVSGGTYATLGAVESDSGALGDTVFPIADRTITNSSGSSLIYEARAVASTTGTGVGTVDLGASFFSVSSPPVSYGLDGGSP